MRCTHKHTHTYREKDLWRMKLVDGTKKNRCKESKKTCNRRHFISIHFHSTVPTLMAQGFFPYISCIPFYSMSCMQFERRKKNSQTKTSNVITVLKSTTTTTTCTHTELDKRNVTRIRNNEANTKSDCRKKWSEKKNWSNFCSCSSVFHTLSNILNGFMTHFVYCYSFIIEKFFNHHNKWSENVPSLFFVRNNRAKSFCGQVFACLFLLFWASTSLQRKDFSCVKQ